MGVIQIHPVVRDRSAAVAMRGDLDVMPRLCLQVNGLQAIFDGFQWGELLEINASWATGECTRSHAAICIERAHDELLSFEVCAAVRYRSILKVPKAQQRPVDRSKML
jgi:hypothetical protein